MGISKTRRTAPRESRVVGNTRGGVSFSESLLWVPDRTAGWRDFSAFPQSLKNSLEDKVNADYNSIQSRRVIYQRTTNNPERYVNQCLNHKIFRASSGYWPPTWKQKLDAQKTSCDYCLKQRRLCVRVEEVNGVFRLGIYPVPESDRGESTPADPSYWILDMES